MDPKIQEYIDAKFKELTDAINFKFGNIDLKLNSIDFNSTQTLKNSIEELRRIMSILKGVAILTDSYL